MDAAGYARFSTDRQKATSITAQLNAITEYCLSNNMDMVAAYVDEARSGTNIDRSGFRDLMRDAKAGKFQAVVIYDISRGSRDVVDWFTFRKEMRALNIQVFSATEQLGDIRDPNAFITELITVGLGQHQAMQSRQKSIAGKTVRAGEGKFCGGIAPLGYRIVDGNYVIEEREAEGVRLIFDWYAAGRSYKDIVLQLRKMGIVGRRGQYIGNNTLYFILRNERYIGRFIWFEYQMRDMHKWVGKKTDNPIVIDGKIPAIIDQQTWERVQKRVAENTANKLNKSRVGRVYLLSGLIKCAHCGGAMVGVTTIAKGREYKFYTCGNKKRLRTCKAKNIKADEIEPLIVTLLREDILNGDIVEKTADAIIAACQEREGGSAIDLKAEIRDINVRIGNLTRSVEKLEDPEPLLERIGELSAQRKVLEEQLKTENVPVQTIDRDALIVELRRDSERLMAEPGNNKELIQKYIVRIDVSDTQITVYAVANLAKKGPQPDLRVVTTTGSPGTVEGVFIFQFARAS